MYMNENRLKSNLAPRVKRGYLPTDCQETRKPRINTLSCRHASIVGPTPSFRLSWTEDRNLNRDDVHSLQPCTILHNKSFLFRFCRHIIVVHRRFDRALVYTCCGTEKGTEKLKGEKKRVEARGQSTIAVEEET